MSRPDRMIAVADVRNTIEKGKLIEDYPEDPRGHSCLILCKCLDGATIHVVFAPKGDFLAVITAYRPAPGEWDGGFRKRKKT